MQRPTYARPATRRIMEGPDHDEGVPLTARRWDVFEIAVTAVTAWWAYVLIHGIDPVIDVALYARFTALPGWTGLGLAGLTVAQAVASAHVAPCKYNRAVWLFSAGLWGSVTVNFLLAPNLSTAPGAYVAITFLAAGVYRRSRAG